MTSQIVFISAFIAIGGFQSVYILLQYIQLRRKEYLYYLGYVTSITCYVLLKYEGIIGFSFFHCFDSAAEVHFDRALPLFSYFLYYRFARHFANIHSLIPRLSEIIKRIEIFILCYVAFELIWELAGGSREISEYIFWAVSVFLFAAAVYFGLWIYSKRNVLVNILIAGAILVNIGAFGTVVLMYLHNQGVYLGIDTMLPITVCFVLELLTFTSGLAYKAKISEREMLLAQNKLLEEKQKNLQLANSVSEMRSKIAAEFHNDISASLSGAAIYVSLLRKAIKENSGNTELLSFKLSESITRLSETVYDTIWALNPAIRTLGDVATRLKSIERNELEPLNCSLNVTLPESLNALPMNVASIKSILLRVKVFAKLVLQKGHGKEVFCNFSLAGDSFVLQLRSCINTNLQLDKIAELKRLLESDTGNLEAGVSCFQADQSVIQLEIRYPLTNIRD